jgi:hypothetical protein
MSTSTDQTLPPDFADLEPFVPIWSLDSEPERHHRRATSTMEEIQTFYDAMLARIDGILAYLDGFPLTGLREPETRLLNLALSLAEVAPAVEFFGQPQVIDGFDSSRFEMFEPRLG